MNDNVWLNMKKQLMIIGIIVILLTVGLSGCTNTTISDEERIIGTWRCFNDL